MRKSIYISITIICLLTTIISIVVIYRHFKEANKQKEMYESLAQIVDDTDTSTEVSTQLEEREPVILPKNPFS